MEVVLSVESKDPAKPEIWQNVVFTNFVMVALDKQTMR